MRDTVKYGLLVVTAAVALAGLGLVVYNFVANDWRLEGNPLDITRLFGGDEKEPEPPSALDERSRAFVTSFPPDSGGAIRIDASNVDVRVSHSDLPRLSVQFILNGDAVDSLLFTARAIRDRNGVVQIVARPAGAPGNYSGQLQVLIPTSARVEIHASAGRVVVQGIVGTTDVETGRGDIEAVGLGGHVRMVAASGGISLSASAVSGELRAGNGNISTSLVQGPLVMRSGRGILVSQHYGSIDAQARGQVALELADPNAGVTVRSTKGDIVMRIPSTGAFSLALDAPLGAVAANVPLDSVITRPAVSTRLRGTMNGGGRALVARADSGSIDISVQRKE